MFASKFEQKFKVTIYLKVKAPDLALLSGKLWMDIMNSPNGIFRFGR